MEELIAGLVGLSLWGAFYGVRTVAKKVQRPRERLRF